MIHMKYIVLLGDGMADWPIDDLDGKTVLDAANTPNMDWIATHGKMGLFHTIPDSLAPGSETANMTIMGYNPVTDLTGRGPLEALSAGVNLEPGDIAFRCNLISIEKGLIKDYSSGHITTEESKPLIEFINKKLGTDSIEFISGIQYRHILKLSGDQFSDKIICTPPHDQLDKPYKDFLIAPMDEKNTKAVYTAEVLNKLIEESRDLLVNHSINEERANNNNNIATNVWFWSGGKKPSLVPFKKKYGLTGGVISAVDLIFGLGVSIGLEPIHVKGATGLLNTNYAGKVQAAIDVLKNKDFVYLHVEAPDEMGHAGDYKKKIQAIEDFDAKIVKPIIEAESLFNNDLTIAVLPDHPTPVKIRTHSRDPVPFAIYSPKKAKTPPIKKQYFSEKNATNAEFGEISSGEQFINLLIDNHNTK
jgi:2,3-bisphosphoglycerate-independent phosphoglycerate mutase